MNTELLPLNDPRSLDATVVGTKAAGLAALRDAGFNVPDAFAVPVAVADDWPDDPVPEPMRQAVAQACEALGPRLAVRSSATWEDGTTSAHAGATATVLDVRGVDATLEAVRHCLSASAQAQRSLHERGGVAIVLQRLVAADHSGVAFTADPISGERDVVRLAATEGLGEALVQGEVVGSDVTLRGDTIDGDLATLPAEDARSVADVARRIEAAFGRPQDIEWAVADGVVHVLQARPITVLPVEPRLPEGNNWQKDVAHYPEPLTPFGYSLMAACGEQIRGVFDEMGLLVRGLEEEFVGGEVYSRVLPAMGSANSSAKPPPAPILGVAARLVPVMRKRTAAARAAIDGRFREGWVDQWHATDRAEMAGRAERLGAVDLAALDDADLLGHADECLRLAQRGQQIHFRLVMPLAQRLYRLHSLVADELGWEDTAIAAMFAGHSPATRAADDAMADLRGRVRSHAGAVAALEADPAQPIDVLARFDEGLAAEVAAWIDEHGWAMVNYDAGVPVLAERPTMITQLLLNEPESTDFDGADAAADEARRALPAGRRAEFDEALQQAREIYAVREDNTIVVGDRPFALLRRWMLTAADRLVARGTIPTASDAAYLTVDELRAAIGGDTAELTERVVRRRGEEAWVRATPGPLYIGNQGSPPDTSRLPAPLREVNEPVLWVIGHEYPPPVETPDEADVLIAGVGASAGVAEGRVRIIRGYEEMGRIQQGDVLVCQVTSPSWAPLFPLVAAVVADGGGALSHAAIASREHGVPAVLGTANGTSTLRDGQRVRIDGTRGLVYDAA
ncbi:MAG: PEP/pyruvate-binding domain-containing protein [Microthrixaceae bacterium]